MSTKLNEISDSVEFSTYNKERCEQIMKKPTEEITYDDIRLLMNQVDILVKEGLFKIVKVVV